MNDPRIRFELVELCEYGTVMKAEAYKDNCLIFATRTRGGYPICENCFQTQLEAARKYEESQERAYRREADYLTP